MRSAEPVSAFATCIYTCATVSCSFAAFFLSTVKCSSAVGSSSPAATFSVPSTPRSTSATASAVSRRSSRSLEYTRTVMPLLVSICVMEDMSEFASAFTAASISAHFSLISFATRLALYPLSSRT